jgi:hypothetical protein
MIGVALVSETRLDLAAFMASSKSVTGFNHVEKADLRPTMSQLGDDLTILRDFADKKVDLSTAVVNLGFLIAGPVDDIREVVEYTRGMCHLSTSRSLRKEIACVLITGNLEHWTHAVIEGSSPHGYATAREAFNAIYTLMCQKGLNSLFDGWSIKDTNDGTFLLLEHKK